MTEPRLYRPCGVNIQADGPLLTRSRLTAGRLGRRRRPYSVRLPHLTGASAEVIRQLIARSAVMFHKRLAWESVRSSPAALASGGQNRTLDRGREKLSHCTTVIDFYARHYERLM
jgi:hypothetical protein